MDCRLGFFCDQKIMDDRAVDQLQAIRPSQGSKRAIRREAKVCDVGGKKNSDFCQYAILRSTNIYFSVFVH